MEYCYRWNNTCCKEPCAVCGEVYKPTYGIHLFVKGTLSTVCWDCSDKHPINQEGEESMESLQDFEKEVFILQEEETNLVL